MYSTDLKLAAQRAYSFIGSFRRVSTLFGIAVSTAWRWLKQRNTSYVGYAKPHGIWIRSKIVIQFIRSVIADNPFITRDMLRKRICFVFQFEPSLKLVSAALRDCGFSRVKTRLQCQGKSPARSEDFRRFASLWEKGEAVAIDECGFQTQHLPIRGYARKGTRLRVTCPEKSRKWITATVAVSGSVGHVTSLSDSPQTGHGFANFVRTPPFPSGTILVMDNASIHKTKEVRVALADKEYSPWYIPAYSPDFNPIENIFGTVKTAWRRHKGNRTCTWSSAPNVITRLFDRLVAPESVMTYFQHTARLLGRHV